RQRGLFKTELIKRRGPWRTVEQVELATLEWVDWSRYAGDPLFGHLGRAGGVAALIGDRSWSSRCVSCAPLVRAAVS
ncbi:MAG TPA: hypothetical protein VKB85_14730, partial [Propionibacteriaceae bacterium]|nr:hypothetical protein [Propionibacteriaceae bacterium]